MSRLRILHVLGELRPSGAEAMLRVAAPVFQRLGCDAEILSTGEQSVGPFAAALESVGFTVHHVPFRRSLRFLIDLRARLKAGRFDVVHIHAERASFWVAIICLAYARAVVRTVHSTFAFSGQLRIRRLLQRRILQALGVRFASISQTVAETEWRTYGIRTVLIRNWYDDSRFRPCGDAERREARERLGVSPDGFVIASVGNCSPIKNHKVVIEALADPSMPAIEYLHAGIEDEGRSERALAETLGVLDRIKFLGLVADPRQVLWAADVFVMPSLHEGFGVAAVEALACGVPCILGDVQGLRDLRSHLPSACYVSVTAEGVRDGLARVLAAEDSRQFTGDATQLPALFGVERGVREYRDLYGFRDRVETPDESCSRQADAGR